jgi:AbiJ-like protein
LKLHVWDRVYRYRGSSYLSGNNPEIKTFCERLWFSHFKRPLDTIDNDWSKVFSGLRKHFFECEWYEVYAFVEFIANNFPYSGRKEFIEACNATLEKEVSAYRFVNGLISRITNKVEVAEIDGAREGARGPVRTHRRRALELLSDRQSPDYRNSIKESISGVESLVATVVGEKGTLGQLIKKLEDGIGLHPALRQSLWVHIGRRWNAARNPGIEGFGF